MAEHRARPLSADFAEAARVIAGIFSQENSAQRPTTTAVTDLVYRGLRHWGLARVRLQRLASREPDLLLQGLLAIAWSALADKRRADYVVVDEAVAAAKQLAGQGSAGFVNALLRKTLANAALAAADWHQPTARYNAPPWWIKKIREDYKDQADAVLSALAARAGLTVRLGGRFAERPKDYLEMLAAAGLQGTLVGPVAVRVSPPVGVDRLPGFSEGLVSVQDAAAQKLVGLLEGVLQRHPGPLQVLDACAAPGGKSIALAQTLTGTVWAMDLSKRRLSRLVRDLPRVQPTLTAQISVVEANVLNPERWPLAVRDQAFDLIVLDAPCSASGVTRRHPESAWKRTPEDVAKASVIQAEMLDKVWRRLKPGGELIFITCSVFSEEGEAQQEAFLARTSDARSLPAPGRVYPIADLEHGQDQDGFFYAQFEKIPALGA
jgi:16S rRNA (cytosine967-C5)-methyltransferase